MNNNKNAPVISSEAIEILEVIKKHREKAYHKVNEELITMYYEIGKFLSEKVASEKWGAKVIETIAEEINRTNPTLKGFDKRGLFRMMQFYETYKDNEIVSPLVSQISWTNNILIFSHRSSIEEKEFYIRLCIKNNYSKRELQRQISSHYFERYMLSDGTAPISTEKRIDENDYPNTRLLDMYSLEFLDLPNNYKEKDLKDAIMDNMKDFILEIGNDFTFVGKEYRVQVGDEDFFIDLLFFNRTYSCLVAFELKLEKFVPEYVSKMSFYLEALDRLVKKDNENPSVGIILCSERNSTAIEFTMAKNLSPIVVAEYKTKLIDKNLLEKKMIEFKKLLTK